jgi:hypothetical protein
LAAVPQIGAGVIKGTASGTDAAGDHFWNHGGNIGAISIHGVPVALRGGNDVKELDAIKGNFTQREL